MLNNFIYKIRNEKFNDERLDLILGLDIPTYAVNFNSSELIDLSEDDKIILGYILWELVISGRLEGGMEIFGKTNNTPHFGLILRECTKPHRTSPDDFKEAFKQLVTKYKDENDFKKLRFDFRNFSNALCKLSLAASSNKKLKIIEKEFINPLIKDKFSLELWQHDLGINFNGYPLEDMDQLITEEIQNMLLENNCRRFPKNRNYKLKLVIEEI